MNGRVNWYSQFSEVMLQHKLHPFWNEFLLCLSPRAVIDDRILDTALGRVASPRWRSRGDHLWVCGEGLLSTTDDYFLCTDCLSGWKTIMWVRRSKCTHRFFVPQCAMLAYALEIASLTLFEVKYWHTSCDCIFEARDLTEIYNSYLSVSKPLTQLALRGPHHVLTHVGDR